MISKRNLLTSSVKKEIKINEVKINNSQDNRKQK